VASQGLLACGGQVLPTLFLQAENRIFLLTPLPSASLPAARQVPYK